MVRWLDRLQRRSRAAGFVIAVIYKFVDDQGSYLAALITYYAFVSLFPLLLLMTTALGVVLAGHPDLQHQVMHSTLSQFPVIGDQLGEPHRLSGGAAGVIIGIVGAVYGGLGVGNAIQNAMDTAWAVPRNKRPDPIRVRLRSAGLLCVLGSAVVGATVLSALAHESSRLGLAGRAGVIAAAVAINAAVALVGFRVTTARELSFRDVAPGAITAAIVWQLLQTFGATYVTHVIRSASRTNGVFALVLGLLAFLYVTALVLVICAEINVVRVERLYPRALLTPFTDDVSLTPGDQKTYIGQAKAQQAKGFQDIDVTFNPSKED
ncbi:MAG TPA: YihY/virulence factor BrkB family protein [Mycobacterium sp.]|nr:YihY/virulence factor BrkB family protein [Mycobacterium sp.]